MRRKKFTVEFSDELDDVIGSLAAAQSVTKVQVLREAVGLLKYVADKRREGHRLFVVDEEGRPTEEITR